MNIVDLIFSEVDPDAIALIDDTQKITFSELADLVASAARNIENHPAQRVGLDCPNGVEHIVLALAIIKTGKCLVPLASELVSREREEIIRETGLGAIVRQDGSVTTVNVSQALEFDEAALTALNPAFIRFSSGTTGKSKGIVLSHATLLERITAANQGLQISTTDKVVWILPMAHHFAVSIILYLWRGATTIIVKSHLAEDVLSAARAHGGTILYGAPFHHGLLAAEPSGREWPGLRLAVSTAAKLPLATANAFFERFGIPLSQGLGIIEVGLSFLNRNSANAKPGSIGKPFPDFTADIRDGQLFIKGPGMFDAYLTPWRTRSSILEDGWFRTGDLAQVDEDGDFHLEGRAHSVINVAGMKCFPEEVEAVLGMHPGVRSVRVYGRPHPKIGAVPVAEIVSMVPSDPPPISALIAVCRSSLARYKVPIDFQFVDQLPMTASGKIKRLEVP